MNIRSIIFCTVIIIAGCGNPSPKEKSGGNSDAEYYSPDDFSSVKKYDTHIHINVPDTSVVAQAAADNFRFLDVNVSPPYYPPLEVQQGIARDLIKRFPGRLAYATSFSIKNFNEPGWEKQSLDYLKQSFENGAIAVKIWKHIGMELKNKQGKFVMADDPAFDSIFNYLEVNHIPLMAHLGEPRNAWLPLDKMTIVNDRNYFGRHPEYHMFLHPDYPSYEDQINARDHLLEKHPNLKFIGAHLGSIEWSVDELAKRLDKFPNMAVDLAARLTAIQYQAAVDRKKVRDFFVRYQDRVIYATDQQQGDTTDRKGFMKRMHDRWSDDWKFFVTDSMMRSPAVEKPFQGLKLPRTIVDKIFRTNAERWFPGIDK